VLRHGGADSFDDVISIVAIGKAQLTGRDPVGPNHVWAVSLEKTGYCMLTEVFPRSSCIVGVVGRRFLSPCDTCKAGSISIFSSTTLTAKIEGQISL
jgi:hypothetical protein